MLVMTTMIGFDSFLDEDRVADLSLFYELFERVQLLPSLKARFAEYIKVSIAILYFLVLLTA